MSDAEALEGALVPGPQPADIRYEDEDRDKVACVTVLVEYADGRAKEYKAREPQDFRMSDPEQMSTMAFRTTGLSIGGGGGFRDLQAGVPALSLSFAANPRYNLHIRNVRTDLPQSSIPLPGISSPETNENGS